MAVDFRITKIDTQVKCTGAFPEKPKNDRYVRVYFEVESYPELKENEDFSISEHDFVAFDKEGVRINNPQGNGYTCLSESDMLPISIGPAEKVIGSIVLDLPKGAAVIVLTNLLTSNGWEWSLTSSDEV
ncbi:hypothetical protein [Timonella sp. A28]|uniref:hypothetical protein n=1 Tax=Timonella sp. A28 TaxID=3442640 RepID=UPI003EB7A003